MPWLALTLALLVLPIGPADRAAFARDLTPHIRTHTLDNGLRIYLLEDHSSPLFTFQYWVEVGSADEWEGKPGITGLSHFFEHLMFKGTERYPGFFKQITSRGGKLNAFTWLDVTVYWDKLASSELEFVLDIESDRLANMRVDFLAVEPEREVVKSERLMRTENRPSGALSEAISATLFQKHSYHWSTVGWMRDLNAITIAQAQEYHRTFYVPNNAFIVLVGSFNSRKALKLIRKYYGPFKKRPVTRKGRTPEPPQLEERRVYVEKPVGTGLLNVTYRSPAGAHADYIALDVAKQLLLGGKTSRLQRSLVHGKDPVARKVSGFMFPFVDEGVLSFEVEMLPGKPNRVAERRLSDEIRRLRQDPVPPAELARAVAQLRADVVRGMATTHSRAQLIGFSVRATDDPTFPWKALKAYGEVTPEDVLRVANRWLRPSSRVVGHAIDPRRLVGLTEQLTKAAPSDTAGLDALLLDAMRYAAKADAFRDDVAAAEVEEDAIRRLEERARVAKAGMATVAARLARGASWYDAAAQTVAAHERIDEYMATSAKGGKKRREKLDQRRATQATTAAALDTQRAELSARWKDIGGDGRRHLWVGNLVGARLYEGVGDRPEAGDALAEWALHALALRFFGGVENAGIADALADADPKDGVLAAVREFAHTAQRVGAGRM